MKLRKRKLPRRLRRSEGQSKPTALTLRPPKEPSSSSYGTSLIKRHRRTGAEMGDMLAEIRQIVGTEEGQITIRHLFYRLVGLRVIEKTEQAYKGLCSHLSKWRRSEEIPWSAFADNTRWHIRQETFNGVHDPLKNTVESYRRNLWRPKTSYFEI